jgi:tripartite-type tricarboxylate transporter receptor subunit TctC
MRLAIALAWCLIYSAPILPQSYPSKPVRLVVSNAPGGATDILGRLIADRLGQRLGQQVLVDNKPGAGGNIAGAFLAHAPADGHTLLLVNHPGVTTAPAISKDAGFEPVRDFAPAALIATQTMLLTQHPSQPPSTLAEFVAYAKARPGQLTYATPGIGSPHHLGMEMLKQQAGIDLAHVPYKGGAPAMQDVVAGRVPVMFASYVIAGPQFQAGKLKVIGVAALARNVQLPNILTFTEQGYAGFDVSSWFAIAATAGTPAAVIARLNGEINAAIAAPGFSQQLLKVGFEPTSPRSPAEVGELLKTSVAKWTKLIRDVNIQAQ